MTRPTLEDYRRDWKPRFGRTNPEIVVSPFWAWMIRREWENPDASFASAYASIRDAGWGGTHGADQGYAPVWCFHRFGRTETALPDGRRVFVGGEHEDFYDPDFHIYNDVVTRDAFGNITVHTYPESVFPPTDFHSATLFGDRLFLIGRLGYRDVREPGRTPVYVLNLRTMAVASVETTGELPGWIYSHEAHSDETAGRIVISGGKKAAATRDGHALMPQFDDWALDTTTLVWTRLTDRSDWAHHRIEALDFHELLSRSEELICIRDDPDDFTDAESSVRFVGEEKRGNEVRYLLNHRAVDISVLTGLWGAAEITFKGHVPESERVAYMNRLAERMRRKYGTRFCWFCETTPGLDSGDASRDWR